MSMINFNNFSNQKNQSSNAISLKAWVDSFHNDSELREIFINLDRAMKYVHEHGYCVKTFDPREIEILNNSLNQIKFNTLLEMPNDIFSQREFIREDIYNSSFIQVGIYTNCLEYLRPDFLRDNFDSFAIFLPESDVSYYKGIVEHGSSVYFSDYVLEKKKRDLASLENEIGGESSNYNKQLVKSNGQSILDDSHINDSINSNIYKQISNKWNSSDAAFINLLVYPTILLVVSVLLALFFLLVSFL